jgi:acylphosphatase
MAQIKAELTVKGKVQKRGYRDHIQEVARDLNVKGYVENMRDGSVKIVCEAEEATLKEFIQAISLKTDLIMVEKVEILRTELATGEYKFFEIKYGSLEEEMGERLVAAFTIAVATRQDIKNMHEDLKDMHHDLKSSINSMHNDMNHHFEEMAKRYDAISAELLRTREELKRSVDTLVELVHKFLEKS